VWGWLKPWLGHRLFHASVVVGLVSGLLTGLFGTGGPPVMLLFSFIDISKGEVRGTSIWLNIIDLLPRFVIMLAYDIFTPDDWRTHHTHTHMHVDCKHRGTGYSPSI